MLRIALLALLLAACDGSDGPSPTPRPRPPRPRLFHCQNGNIVREDEPCGPPIIYSNTVVPG